MRKLFSFLIIGLFLTAFQIVEVDAQRGDSVDDRDPRSREEVDTRDTPVEEDVETRGLSTKEMIQECKKTYGKKKKNKEAKLACIAAAKGQ